MTSAPATTIIPARRRAHTIAALARAEGVLLRRSRIALLTAVAAPVLLAGAVKALPGAAPPARAGGAAPGLLIALTAFALLYPVYHNLVVTLAGRREQLVLKRLRTGEATDGEILAGTALPAIAVAWAQIAVAAVAAAAVPGLHPGAAAVLALAGLAGGTAVFALLAIVTSAVTRSAELAQVTTLPALAISLAGSGLLFPLTPLPDAVRLAAQALPLTAVTSLMRLGLTATAAGGQHPGLAASLGGAAVPVLVLAAWIAAAGWAARRWFRWEPRR
ncbi:MAG TPA: ABC transporter permease [Streptosporangiaceae bacterium]|nr:ABC transporter permease [Streptosporangiaceae bacterium]